MNELESADIFCMSEHPKRISSHEVTVSQIHDTYDPPREPEPGNLGSGDIFGSKFIDFCLPTLIGPFSAVRRSYAEIFFGIVSGSNSFISGVFCYLGRTGLSIWIADRTGLSDS